MRVEEAGSALGSAAAVSCVAVLFFVCAAAHSGCVADRSDAIEMTDRNLYHDLAAEGGAVVEGAAREKKSLRTGKRMREWSASFSGKEEVSLADCFRLALVRSEELLIQGEKLFETWTMERESISSLLPEVNVNWTFSRDSEEISFGGKTISPRDSSQGWVSVRQKLFDGRSLAAIPAAREARRIERLTLEDRRDRLLFSVAAGFYEILGFEHDVLVFEASLESAEEFYRVVEARRMSGEASRQDTLSAMAQRDQAESVLIQARHDLDIARVSLARLIGIERLPKKLLDDYEVALGPGRIPELVKAAGLSRPDLEAARVGIDFAKAERLAALSEYLPLVTADFTRWIKREGAFSSDIDWNLSVNLVWTLYNSGVREARQARALSVVRQREYELRALERQVRYEVNEAVLSFESLGRVLGALQSRAEASRAALDLANAEYKASEATELDVMIARSVWEEAECDLARTMLARKLGAMKIDLAAGRFDAAAPLLEAVEVGKE